jgi:hypothetical protein
MKNALHYWPSARYWNIALRTMHIVVTGALFGGHVFDVPRERLLPWLCATLLSGAALSVLEATPSLTTWFAEVRGLCVLGKLALLLAIPWFWPYRAGILLMILVAGCVGSHLPRRWRHYSPLHGRVMEPKS